METALLAVSLSGLEISGLDVSGLDVSGLDVPELELSAAPDGALSATVASPSAWCVSPAVGEACDQIGIGGLEATEGGAWTCAGGAEWSVFVAP